MKIVYFGVYYQMNDSSAHRLASAQNLYDFGYFTRSTIAQHIQFASRTCIMRTKRGCRQTVQLDEQTPFVAHCYVRSDGLAAITLTDKEYPPRVAFTLLTRTLSQYEQSPVGNVKTWSSSTADQDNTPDYLTKDLEHYQNPREADKLTAIQSQLDEVKDVMHTNIDNLMKRGETLDSLMAKSDDLSAASVTFFQQAKKQNSCCKY